MSRLKVICSIGLIIPVFAASCNMAKTASAPTATQTTVPTIQPTETPTIEPTVQTSATPGEIPTVPPINPDLYLPNGIATFNPETGNVSYFNSQGQLLGEIQTPNLGTGLFQQAVILGILAYPGPSSPSLAYFSTENGGEIWLSADNNPTKLRDAPNLLNMIGVPGKSTIAYTLLEFQDFGLVSQLFLADAQSLSSTQPVMSNTNTESYAIKPLAISINKDQPVGVWYTTIPYGIGGDIVFEPRNSLNYFDIEKKQISSYLDMTIGPAGISGDQTWVAYTPAGGKGSLSIAHNFDFSTAITFPLRPDSDRGAGEALFSPDNQYVTWKEASGSISSDNPAYYETIRIGKVDGNILTELPDSSLTAVSGFSDITSLTPVGWLDTQTLVLEATGNNGENACLMSVRVDGSGLTFLVPGAFIGFLYP